MRLFVVLKFTLNGLLFRIFRFQFSIFVKSYLRDPLFRMSREIKLFDSFPRNTCFLELPVETFLKSRLLFDARSHNLTGSSKTFQLPYVDDLLEVQVFFHMNDLRFAFHELPLFIAPRQSQ